MAKKDVRIDMKVGKPDAFVSGAKILHTKDTTLGDGSPLRTIRGDFGDKLTQAEGLRARSKELRAESEAVMQQANAILGFDVGQTSETPGTLYYYMTLFRDQLLVSYRGNEEQLSTWGFDVVISGSVPRHGGEGGEEPEEEV